MDGDTTGVAWLLSAGAEPDASVPAKNSSGEAVQTTALFVAGYYGRLETARLLLDAGADPSLADIYGTPLLQAAGSGQLEALQLLLERGAGVDAADPENGSTAFHAACRHNQPESAEELAGAGCDVGLKDKNGLTGREVAEANGHAAVVARLRAVVGEQLRAAQMARASLAPEPAAVVGDGGPAVQLLAAAMEGDAAAVSLMLEARAGPNTSVAGMLPSGSVDRD
jgi:hypothetical protein